MENKNHKEQVQKALQIGKLLPETRRKVDYYSEVIDSDQNLLNIYQQRQKSFFVSKLTKAIEKIEILSLKNSIIQKQKVFESYVDRKNEYEKWLDEITIEVNANFDELLEEAKNIPYSSNPRLQDGINKFESFSDTNTSQDKVEMYFFVKNEVLNYKKRNKLRVAVQDEK